MLVMRRREGESIKIGDSVEVRILAISGCRVKIGITAPRAISVQAQEVDLVRAQNQAAAQVSPAAAAEVVAKFARNEPRTLIPPGIAENFQGKRPIRRSEAINSPNVHPAVGIHRGQ